MLIRRTQATVLSIICLQPKRDRSFSSYCKPSVASSPFSASHSGLYAGLLPDRRKWEFYEYENFTLKSAWHFDEYQRYPMSASLVLRFMPDRIFNPDIYKYTFKRDDEGLTYVCEHFYRKSKTLTNEDHVSNDKLLNLKENGLSLVNDL